MEGCSEFMRSLEQFDEDERFSLGSGHIFIKGGVRKARQHSAPRGRGRGRGAGGPPGGAAAPGGYNHSNNTHQHHNSTAGRTGLGRAGRGSGSTNGGNNNNNNRSYERNFPDLNNAPGRNRDGVDSGREERNGSAPSRGTETGSSNRAPSRSEENP